ncbi:MAG: universal stress protein, partial [Flammeovirgaceae bacterium]
MFKHILVPIDFSQQAMHAVDVATDLAKKLD